jgi:hypothetical protein
MVFNKTPKPGVCRVKPPGEGILKIIAKAKQTRE